MTAAPPWPATPAEPRSEAHRESVPPLALLVSDIDGTLVTAAKVLTPGAVGAVRRLAGAGIGFTLLSSRPPRGMMALVAQLGVRLPFGAFNGGSLIAPDLTVLTALRLSPDVARRVLALFAARGVGVWVFADGDWLAQDRSGRDVAGEERAIGFAPRLVADFGPALERIDKIVGVSSDSGGLRRLQTEAQVQIGDAAAIRLSQPGHLDVTHPRANKGDALRALSTRIGIEPGRVAVIGDSFNDVPMFQAAAVSIAMGQAAAAVKAQASRVTVSNGQDGFARAVERFILPSWGA